MTNKKLFFYALALFISAQSCASDSSASANTTTIATDSNINQDSVAEVAPSTTFPALLVSVDSACKKDGNGLQVMNKHTIFIETLQPSQMDTLYMRLVDGINTYLDKNIPFLNEKYLDKNNEVKEKYVTEFNDKGIRIQFDGDGGYFPAVNQGNLFVFFDGKVTPALQEFIAFFSKNEEYIAFDGGLVATPNEIAERILFYDWHLVNYPTFERKDIVLGMYAQEMYFIMFGLDNTPAFSYADDLIFDEHKVAMNMLLDKGSPFTKKFLGNYVTALKANNWKYLNNGYDKYYFGIDQARKKEMK